MPGQEARCGGARPGTAFLLPVPGLLPDLVLGDGATGTMLQAAGLSVGEAPERWNLERPEEVSRLHEAYARAGARWVSTNTFGANRARLARIGWEDRVVEVNAAAVRCARAGAPALPVLGSIGPTGRTEAECERAYAEQVEALQAGVDGFLVETIVRLDEGLAAVRAARAAGGPVVAAFSPGPGGDLLDGTRLERAAEAIVRAGAAGLGVNCGSGTESLLDPARRLVRAGFGNILAAPSAGLPTLHRGRARYSLSPDAFARAAIQFRDAGVRLFAGCCGTSPEHVRAAARALVEGERA